MNLTAESLVTSWFRRTVMAAEIELACSGSVNGELNGKLFIECIKFLLYERQQLPLPFHDLKRLIDEQPSGKPSGKMSANSKKANQSFSDLEELFDQLDKLFLSEQVTSAVIIFGSTAVSPKECYVMEFPESDPLADCCPNFGRLCESSCRKLIRSLVTNHNVRLFKEIAPTSMLIFVRLNRNADVEWFRPKTSFKLPRKGEQCKIKVTAADHASPLERGSHGVDCDELLWFQAPLNIKGYKGI